MNTTTYLADRLCEVLTEGIWVSGTNYKKEILTTHWKDAIKCIDPLNTVAKITFHVHYYIDGLIKVLEGGPLHIKDKYSFDAPPIKSEKDWNNLTSKFCYDSEKLIGLIKDMSEEDLLNTFEDEKYGNYLRNLDLMIEHGYYHLGQIVLIKKLIQQRNND